MVMDHGSAGVRTCPIPDQYCVQAFLPANHTMPFNATAPGAEICFLVQSADAGWAALGVSTFPVYRGMWGANIYMAWNSASAPGTVVYSERLGKGQIQPLQVAKPQSRPLTKAERGMMMAMDTPAWAKTTFAFCRPIAGDGKDLNPITPTTTFMVASNAGPDTPLPKADARIAAHTLTELFEYDFVTRLAEAMNGGGNDTMNGTTTAPAAEAGSSASHVVTLASVLVVAGLASVLLVV
jgi:hypothetical protein